MYRNFHKRLKHFASLEWNGGSRVDEVETVEMELRAFLGCIVEIQKCIENVKTSGDIGLCVSMFDTMMNELGIDTDYVKSIKRKIEEETGMQKV